MGKAILQTEEQCVNHCLEFPACVAVTLVGSNPGQYGDDLEGCYKKWGGWTVRSGTAYEANMVSIDVSCIRNKREFSVLLLLFELASCSRWF